MKRTGASDNVTRVSRAAVIEPRGEGSPSAPAAAPTPGAPGAPRWAWGVLAVVLVAGAALCLYETRGTTLSFDEWAWAIWRRGGSLSTWLHPYNGHFSVVPLAIYKAMFAIFGIRHYLPYRLAVTAAHLACVTLVFVYARRRVGSWLALLAAAWIMLLGPAWQNFLWSFQIAWLLSIAAGIGTLLALDRGDRRGEFAAAVLLAVSLASSGLGLAVAAGVCADVVLTRGRARRAWGLAPVLVLYAVWWAVYQTASTRSNALVHIPGFAARAASATMAALAGLAGSSVPFGSGTLLTYGPALAIAAVLALLIALARGRGSARAISLLTVLVAFWILISLGRTGIAVPYSSRYLYVAGVFVVLLIVELARGVRFPRPVLAAVSVLILAAVASNVREFAPASTFLRGETQATVADLGALDIARPVLAADYRTVAFPGFGLQIPARDYFAMERSIGTPAASPAGILRLPEGPRQLADIELIAAERVQLTTAPRLGKACRQLAPGGGITLPPRGVTISAAGSPVTVSVRRFGDSLHPIGTVASGRTRRLRIAPDASGRPWSITVAGPAPALLCA